MSYPDNSPETVEDYIMAGIRELRPITFTYLKGNPNNTEVRVVSIFEVNYDEGTFLGYDHRREGLRRFSVSRVSEVDFADDDYIQPVLQD